MGPRIPAHAYFNCDFTEPEDRNHSTVNVALLSYRRPGELLLTIIWINHRGSVPTTSLRSMQQAIDMALSNEVLNLPAALVRQLWSQSTQAASCYEAC